MLSKTTSLCLLFLALCAPLSVSADVIINEFLYDAPGTDTDQEFIELLNTGSTPIDLTKWKINDGSSHTLNVPPKNGGTGSISIAPGGYALLVDNATNFLATHPGLSGTVIDTVLSLANLSGTISLSDDTGTVVSSVTYSKDQGGNGDGNSLQRKDSAWIMALPTPNAANATVAAVPADTSTTTATTTASTATTTASTQSTTNTAVSSYVAPPVPTLFADAGDDRTVIVGADTEFDGRAYDRDRQDVERVRFMWNFGDGSTAEGPAVLHHYEYPGRYAVILSIAQNKTAVIDKVIVEALPARLSFTTLTDGGVSIGNQDSRDLDLSGWIVRSFARTFTLPEHSVILTGSTLHISHQTLDFFSAPETELEYPNGVLALKANASTPAAPIETAAAPVPVESPVPEPVVSSITAAAKKSPVRTATSEPEPEAAMKAATSSIAQTAGAGNAVRGSWYWYAAVAGLVLLLGGAMYFVRGMKANEWDIEESEEAE